MSEPAQPQWDEFAATRRYVQQILNAMVERGDLRIVGETPDSGPLYEFVERENADE